MSKSCKPPLRLYVELVSFILLLFITVVVVTSQDDEHDALHLPPLLDADDVAYFFQHNQLDQLHSILDQVFYNSRRNPYDETTHKLPATLVARGGGDQYTTHYKLKLDLEQAHYLAIHAENDDTRQLFRDTVIPIYETVLQNIPPLEQLQKTQGLYPFSSRDYEAGIRSVYNKALHHTDYDTLRDDDGEPIPLLNPNLPDISAEYNKEGIIVVDNVLSDAALQRIRQLLLESTVWFQTKMPLKFGGYVGAYIDDGLYDRILLELAMELSQKFPNIFEGHPLRYLWAYKYDSDYTGINLHADEAAVNVNLWLTPDEANLDPTSGGLVVFTAKPPHDWKFEEYNTDTDFVREQLLKPTNYANVTIPHRQNRAVIFDSALFHQTDVYKFRKGYENRRINLTLLYGKMQKAKPKEQEEL